MSNHCIQCVNWIVKDEHDKKMALLGFRRCAKGEIGRYRSVHAECDSKHFEQINQNALDKRIAFHEKLRKKKLWRN